MKNIIYIGLILILFGCRSQKSGEKEEVYVFQDKEISRAKSRSFRPIEYFKMKSENDSLITYNIFPRKSIGKLDSLELEQVRTLLSKIIGSEFDPGKKAMIHLYSNNEANIYVDSNYRRYWNWIETNSQSYQAFLIGTKDSQIVPDSDHIYIDEYNLLEHLFFKQSPFQTNHFLLKPDGEIYTYFGVQDILTVLDFME